MRPFTCSCFLLLLDRLSLLGLFHLLGTCFSSLCSLPFSLHAPALIPLFLSPSCATLRRWFLCLLNTFYCFYQPIRNQFVLFSPILCIIFLCFFSNHVFAMHNSFSSQNSSIFFPQHFFCQFHTHHAHPQNHQSVSQHVY